VAAEIKRLDKQLADKKKAAEVTRGKLANEKFVSGAPPEVVQQQRELLADIDKQIAALEENLTELRSS
jgi:valyl-tRNA synthetase